MPYGDPRLTDWTEADWLREAAWLEIELEPPGDDAAVEEAFDEEIELAAEGDWAALGLDAPGEKTAFLPESIEEFLKGGE